MCYLLSFLPTASLHFLLDENCLPSSMEIPLSQASCPWTGFTLSRDSYIHLASLPVHQWWQTLILAFLVLFLSVSPPWIGLSVIFLGLALQSVLLRGGSFFPSLFLPDVLLLFCMETLRSLLAGHWGSEGPSIVLSHSYSEQKLESMSPWPAFSYLPFVFCCLLSPFSLEISSFQVSFLYPLSIIFWLISIRTYMLSLIYDTYNIFLLFNLLI